jgi:hypothetical protein
MSEGPVDESEQAPASVTIAVSAARRRSDDMENSRDEADDEPLGPGDYNDYIGLDGSL